MRNNFAEEIYDIAVETFELMCFMFPLDEDEVDDATCLDQEDAVSAVATFDGAAEGAMVLRVCPELVSAIALNMLGSDDATIEQKQGALCEIVNIICGNIAPFFTTDKDICYIRPPRIMGPGEDPDVTFGMGKKSEKLSVYLDEGLAEITVYYA